MIDVPHTTHHVKPQDRPVILSVHARSALSVRPRSYRLELCVLQLDTDQRIALITFRQAYQKQIWLQSGCVQRVKVTGRRSGQVYYDDVVRAASPDAATTAAIGML